MEATQWALDLLLTAVLVVEVLTPWVDSFQEQLQTQAEEAHMSGRSNAEFREGVEDGRRATERVVSERVARAAARALLAANDKLGVESTAKVKRLATRP